MKTIFLTLTLVVGGMYVGVKYVAPIVPQAHIPTAVEFKDALHKLHQEVSCPVGPNQSKCRKM